MGMLLSDLLNQSLNLDLAVLVLFDGRRVMLEQAGDLRVREPEGCKRSGEPEALLGPIGARPLYGQMPEIERKLVSKPLHRWRRTAAFSRRPTAGLPASCRPQNG